MGSKARRSTPSRSLRRQSQSSLYPYGNCWQTVIACVLEMPAEDLPPQADIERFAHAARRRWPFDSETPKPAWCGFLSYRNVINRFLRQHHGLVYGEIGRYQVDAVSVQTFGGYHVMCGPSPRTAAFGGINHCVLGRRGKMVWDPHPSRAGLVKLNEWGVICDLPKDWKGGRMEEALPCLCSACGGLTQLVEACTRPAGEAPHE